MKPKLTPWFPGTVKPVRPGVYQRDWTDEVCYSMWDGRQWLCSYSKLESAARSGLCPGDSQDELPWRGLASKP